MSFVDEWVDDIRIEVSEPTDLTLSRSIRFAIQEFFRLSESWKVQLSVTKIADTSTYRLSIPADTYIIAADYVYFTDETGARIKLESVVPERVDTNATGTPTSFYVTQDSIVVSPATYAGTLEIGVTVSATRDIDEVPDSISLKCFEYIRAGAISRLLAMPDKIWSNLQIAAVYEQTFMRGVAEAKRDARQDRSRPVRQVKYGGIPW